MSLTRKLLESLGLESDKVSTIIEAHAETVDALKEKIEMFKADAEQLPEVKESLTKATEELEALKKDGGDWQKKYESEHDAFEKFKGDLAEKEALNAKKTAYAKLLKDAGVADSAIDKITRLTDLSALEIEDGKLKDEDSLTQNIHDEWSEFIVNTRKEGAKTQRPPKNDGTFKTKEEIMKIKDATARQKAIQENHELFGF